MDVYFWSVVLYGWKH